MLNFIKSEYYRMIHTTGIRVFFGILSVLTILLICMVVKINGFLGF